MTIVQPENIYQIGYLGHIIKLLWALSDTKPVWPDWAIYWTLGNFSKPVATISFPKYTTFLGNI